jgi:LemA protein
MRGRSQFLRMIAPAVALSLAGCGINSVPTAEEAAKAQWGNVQNQYQRRADLVPNLVATVQGFAQQERAVLTEVTNARARATGINLSADDLSDPAKVQQFEAAQGALSQSLGRLLVVAENYPELRSSENFLALQSQLEGTENRIANERRIYNERVQAYNTEIRTFPAIVAAKVVYGSKPMTPFQATTPGAETAPTVKF